MSDEAMMEEKKTERRRNKQRRYEQHSEEVSANPETKSESERVKHPKNKNEKVYTETNISSLADTSHVDDSKDVSRDIKMDMAHKE